GAGSLLSTAGVAKVFPDSKGLRQGDVLRAGTVTLNAVTGYVVTEPGSVIDVSGAPPVQLDRPTAQGGFGMVVAGDAGSVNIAAREGALLAGTMRAAGGGAQTRPGSFSLALGSKDVPGVGLASPTADRIVEVGGTPPVVPANLNDLSGF